ncbi:MAG: PD-(D/E)XK nuclease family protein, partial [Pseudomonadales bacterium]
DAPDTEQLDEVLQKRLALSGYAPQWQSVLSNFVWHSLRVDLIAQAAKQRFCLADICAADRLVEMEFVLPFKAVHCGAINDLLVRYEPLASMGGQLNFRRVAGMLKGFIDLTLRRDGRYFVVDYKSNFLGDSVADYSIPAMETALVEHRYDFQFILYTLALHRLLKVRLVNYDYDLHIGGVFYLFLRGMQPGSDSGVYYNKPARELIEGLDALFEEGA